MYYEVKCQYLRGVSIIQRDVLVRMEEVSVLLAGYQYFKNVRIKEVSRKVYLS